MILIVAHTDSQTRQVAHRLRQKGAEVVRFNVGDMPKHARVTAWVGGGEPARVGIRRDGATIGLDAVNAVWFRRMPLTAADESLDEADAEFARAESTAFLYGIGATLADRFCCNPLVAAIATDKGRGKVHQLELARRIGMEVPRTLVTNDPEAAGEFLRRTEGAAIYKPITALARTLGEPDGSATLTTVFTTKLDAAARERLEDVRFAPCIFQELVPKRFDLRVTVIGDKVFGTEIHSQLHDASSVDFRRHYAFGETPYVAHDMPAALVEHCRTLNRALGLVFGAYDFICTPDGRYVFLEVNQQGQFLWLEEMSGQPLLENFCELLIQKRRDFRCDAASHAPGPFEACPPVDEHDVA